MDYVFDRLDFDDTSDAGRARQRGWLSAVQRGFHEGRPQEGIEKMWRTHVEVDGVVCTGAWLPDGAFGAREIPVATFAWFDKTVNAGHDLAPLRMITDVTASPAHRRRGLVRRLMEDCLDDAAAAGLPLAALTASEATIYGRWGFGAATLRQSVEVDTGPRFGLRGFTDSGRVELVEPADAWPIVKDVFDRFHRATRGSVDWPQFYETLHSGSFDWGSGGPNHKLRGAVHLTADESVDGVCLYHLDGDGDDRQVKVDEMMALTPEAGLGLWQLLGGIDLVSKVRFGLAHPDDPLRWALTDINAAKYTALAEFLWIRVLDVPAALAVRPWTADGSVVLEVDDAQGHAAGRWRVETADGHATATLTDDAADVRLDAEALGSLYLGGASVTALHRAGRITGDGIETFAAMADLATPPYNLTGF